MKSQNEWKNISVKYSIIRCLWEIWWIVLQNSLQIQIEFQSTKWFKCKIHSKIASHHNISIKFNDFALTNNKSTILAYIYMRVYIPPFQEKLKYKDALKQLHCFSASLLQSS